MCDFTIKCESKRAFTSTCVIKVVNLWLGDGVVQHPGLKFFLGNN